MLSLQCSPNLGSHVDIDFMALCWIATLIQGFFCFLCPIGVQHPRKKYIKTGH